MTRKIAARPLMLTSGVVLGVGGLVAFLALVVLIVSHEVLLFKSMPMNGAFQLYNPLQRLAAGELLGRDFDFFHGSGTLLLHYPLFALLGGDLLASELSRNLMGLVAFLACFHLCAAAWKIPACMASFAACAALVVGEALMRGSGALCGSSMVGLRSTLPVVVLTTAIVLSRRFGVFRRPAIFHAYVGLGLGGSIFVATEQGLAALAVYGLLLVMVPIVARTRLAGMGWTIYAGIIALITFTACVAMVSRGHVIESLRFALVDLPKEQFWYFGAPPNDIPEFPAMFWNVRVIIGFWLPSILAGCEIARMRARSESLRAMPMESALVFLLLGLALVVQVPQLAAYSHYQDIATRNMGLVAMLWIFRFGRGFDFGRLPVLNRLKSMRVSIPAVIAILSMMVLGVVGIARYLQSKRQHPATSVQYCGMTLCKGWASDLAVWHELDFSGARVAASYRALIEDKKGSAFRGPDYLIHALGSRRARFLENLKCYAPDYFLTINPDFSQYEEWLQLRHWDVYRYLIEHYAPVRASDFHVFWKRRSDGAGANPGTAGSLIAVRNGEWWQSPANTHARGVYSVRVRYSVDNPLGVIPVAGKLTRYLLSRDTASGSHVTNHLPASLPPTESLWEFPIILDQGEHARFALTLRMAVPGCRAMIQSIELEEISHDTKVIEALADGGKLVIDSKPGA